MHYLIGSIRLSTLHASVHCTQAKKVHARRSAFHALPVASRYIHAKLTLRHRLCAARISHGSGTAMSECTGALRRANECAAACACARRSHAPFSERFVSKTRFQPRVFVRTGCPPQIHCRTKQSISHKGQKRQFTVKCDNCFSLLRTKKFRATASVVIFFIVNSRQC